MECKPKRGVSRTREVDGLVRRRVVSKLEGWAGVPKKIIGVKGGKKRN
jgi:hypothetical protein